MSGYELTPEAKADIHQIRRFSLSHWGELQTNLYLTKLTNSFSMLAEHPRLGTHRPDVRQEAYSFPCQSHVIYYICKTEKVIVFAVLHKHMIPEQHLTERDTLSKN
ncbi:type II toxin-antitoxin system RelE/ParE family toxin [Alkalimonas delamerensis]|uniref:Toxin n=1 Tax=Alkalimonas delamerensis TaxID=265981 RepID=A0ABT9GQC4_9GAMM|nr:type II toxin-antitoxin system RelE/ParE family toxin [Alkalimonas delamerensis]MDP4529178.1 type II toxin-antitoxin system RelE/ParE family toxin [Alkalimonas delamerensis]